MDETTLPKKSNLEVLNLFRRDIFLSGTIRQLAIMLGKPYPKVHASVHELRKTGILDIKKVGKSSVCRLQLSNVAISILSFIDEQEALSKKLSAMDKVLDFRELLDDIVIVTGSHANGTWRKGSDIDLVVITRDKPAAKQKLLENLTSLMTPSIHPAVMSYKDFVGMLISREESYGREIFRNRLIFRNAKRYYELIKEAVANGFSG